ncbi:hypothetical protein NFI95_15410 [Acetobacteraceae bacterium KSS8]|uniref:Uncharacterized protein n=1 Tax=Endosaccharibacter trunci TaxID=2812733 RepID=A0ABT1WAC0_9PROT|nr:hypothetical protein [Acetobacteraceae bacterium KSS8]
MQLDLLAGLTIGRSGPEAAPASPSPSPVNAQAKRTRAISGQTNSDSSVPAGPLSGWESKLRLRLESRGSTECVLTWKVSATPSARPLSRLVPSMRPTVETGCGSSLTDLSMWPTAQHREKGGGEYADPEKALARMKSGHQVNLQDVVKVADAALYATPAARDYRMPNAKPGSERGQGCKGEQLPNWIAHQVLAMLATPTSLAPARNGNNEAGNSAGLVSIRRDAMADPHGAITLGCAEPTEKPGGLNPAFVCWLMGFPAAWDACAPTAMPSSRKSRPK